MCWPLTLCFVRRLVTRSRSSKFYKHRTSRYDKPEYQHHHEYQSHHTIAITPPIIACVLSGIFCNLILIVTSMRAIETGPRKRFRVFRSSFHNNPTYVHMACTSAWMMRPQFRLDRREDNILCTHHIFSLPSVTTAISFNASIQIVVAINYMLRRSS